MNLKKFQSINEEGLGADDVVLTEEQLNELEIQALDATIKFTEELASFDEDVNTVEEFGKLIATCKEFGFTPAIITMFGDKVTEAFNDFRLPAVDEEGAPTEEVDYEALLAEMEISEENMLKNLGEQIMALLDKVWNWIKALFGNLEAKAKQMEAAIKAVKTVNGDAQVKALPMKVVTEVQAGLGNIRTALNSALGTSVNKVDAILTKSQELRNVNAKGFKNTEGKLSIDGEAKKDTLTTLGYATTITSPSNFSGVVESCKSAKTFDKLLGAAKKTAKSLKGGEDGAKLAKAYSGLINRAASLIKAHGAGTSACVNSVLAAAKAANGKAKPAKDDKDTGKADDKGTDASKEEKKDGEGEEK